MEHPLLSSNEELDKYKEFVSGKEVVVIGGAPITDQTLKPIDDFEVVVRLNNGIRALDDIRGHRTDVVYHCLGMRKVEDAYVEDELTDVPFIIFSQQPRPRSVKKFDRILEVYPEPKRKVILPGEAWWQWFKLKTGGRHNFHTGTIAIFHLLSLGCEVHTRGITLFQGPCYDQRLKTWSDNDSRNYANSCHALRAEVEYLRLNYDAQKKSNKPHTFFPCPILSKILDQRQFAGSNLIYDRPN